MNENYQIKHRKNPGGCVPGILPNTIYDSMTKVALLCSKGGRLQEMMGLKDAWGGYDHFFITYDSERTEALEDRKYLITHPISGSMEFVLTLFKAMSNFILEKPDVMISTGMGWVDIFMFPLSKIIGTYSVYIESAANVDYITGTGKLVRKFANRFLVQWEELAENTGAEYHGGVL